MRKRCRVLLRVTLESYRLPELQENEKFILEARVGRQRAYASTQFSNKCMEYPCVPPEKLEFTLDPHDAQNKILYLSLKIFKVKQHAAGGGGGGSG